MKIKEIKITLRGKSDSDLSDALDEAVEKIQWGGCLSGRDENDTGSFVFESTVSFEEMKMKDISAEAEKLAKYFDSTGEKPEDALRRAALNAFVMNEFQGFIPGNTASMMQLLIDECGGVDQEGHLDVTDKLGDYFSFLPGISTLFDED